jgi:Immunity protein 53
MYQLDGNCLMSNILTELQQWYASNCNGDWEHSYGIKIETLDNPGWLLKIELEETNLQNHSFISIDIDNNEDDWYICKVNNNRFEALGDPTKLNKLIEIFLDWAKLQNPDWLTPPTSGDLQLQVDRDFYNSLKNSPTTLDICHKDGCDKFHLEYSVLCVDHHFEMLRNYSFSATAEVTKNYEVENYWD